MSELNALFRRRIGLSEKEDITFENLNIVLERTAKTVPFENFRIIDNKTDVISRKYLVNKILVNNEGGLCYELNSILYLFLIENGFNAVLTRGVVFNNNTQEYLTLGRTHVTILLTHEEQTYVIDTGFGGNLPLKPVPLTGETVDSSNGQFRIKKVNSEFGDYSIEMILKHKDSDWKTGYAFDSKKTITEISEGNAVQKIIVEHQESPFNKQPLITRLTNGGSVTLTNTSITQWNDGIVTKEKIDYVRFNELLKQHFGM